MCGSQEGGGNSCFSVVFNLNGTCCTIYCTSQYIGMMGKVHYIDDNGDLLVNYFSNSMFHINPAAVTKVKEIYPLFVH